MILGPPLITETTKEPGRGYRWEGPPEENPDWGGIKMDTAYFIVYQFLAVAIIYLAPESFSGWSEEDKEEYSLSKWWENVKNPIWDEDKWYINYILHPYWGATFYIRARERGFAGKQSFWYAFLLSTLYEFGAEALFEPVSYQDMVVSPVAGALLGKYAFYPIRKRIRAKEEPLGWVDKAVLLLTDPLGVANEAINLLFGVNSEVCFSPLNMFGFSRSPGLPGEAGSTELHTGPLRPGWGLQMKVSW